MIDGEGLRRPRSWEPLPEAPVECPGRGLSLGMGGCLILESHSRIGGWGGERLGGEGRKEGYRARGPGGESQAGHGGCPRAQRPGSRRRPRARDPLDCWACAVLVTAQNLLVAAFNLLLLALVLGTILLPAVTMLGFGFTATPR